MALVKKICTMMDEWQPAAQSYQHLITYVKDRPGHDYRYAVDITKLRAAGIWLQPQAFDATLQKTIEFYCQHAQEKAVFV